MCTTRLGHVISFGEIWTKDIAADGEELGLKLELFSFVLVISLVSSDHTPNNEMTSGGFAKQVGYNF